MVEKEGSGLAEHGIFFLLDFRMADLLESLTCVYGWMYLCMHVGRYVCNLCMHACTAGYYTNQEPVPYNMSKCYIPLDCFGNDGIQATILILKTPYS